MAAREHEPAKTATPAEVTTAQLPSVSILQAPRYQRDKGLYEAVAKLSTGEKVTVTASDENQTWFNLNKELGKQGHGKAVVGGEYGAKYNTYLASLKQPAPAPEKE